MHSSPFEGQRVVVVGGASRLGAALALASMDRGAEVVVAARHRPVGRLGDQATYLEVDLSNPETIVAMGEGVGTFDHLVSTVSMHAVGPLLDLSDSDIQASMDAKVLGPLRLARATAGKVRDGGSLTFFSGQAAWRPHRGGTVMATVNGAQAFLVAALAVELAPVRVNAVAPGVVDSGAHDRLGDEKEQVLADAARQSLVGRVGTVDDIVDATMMLMSNGYMTGTVLHVDGGAPLA